MVRLVFRPYTQVRRTICTSVSLRASTRVSSGFTLLRHSSPSFGSRHTCSTQTLRSSSRSVGRACPSLSFRTRAFHTRVLAHVSDSLVRVSRRVGGARSVSSNTPHSRRSEWDRQGLTQRHLSQRAAKADPTRRSAPHTNQPKAALRSAQDKREHG